MPTTPSLFPTPQRVETPIILPGERGCADIHSPGRVCRNCGEVERGPVDTWLCLDAACTARIPTVLDSTPETPDDYCREHRPRR